MIAAFRRASSFRGDSAVTTWLHRIVVNAALDRMRRRASRPTTGGQDEEALDALATSGRPLSDPSGTSDTAMDVRAALRRLVPDQQAALVLVDMLGYSIADAAEVLGVSEGTVKSRAARGRARLLPRLAHLRPAGETPSDFPEAETEPIGAPARPTCAGGGRRSTMTRHASAEDLAGLDLDALKPRKAAKIRGHVGGCVQCTQLSSQVSAVPAMLASQPYPAMPASVSTRLDTALASESAQRLASAPATEAGRRDLPDRSHAPKPRRGWQLPGMSVAGTRLVAAAGALVIVGVGRVYEIATPRRRQCWRNGRQHQAPPLRPAQPR